jgi:peptide/nickel transport system permease protein
MDPILPNSLEKAYNYYRNGQLSRASQLLVELIKHDPEHEKAWHLLSYVLKDLDRQIYAVQRVLKINPQNQTARIRLRKLSTLREDEDTGETLASGAVEGSPPEVTRHTEWIHDQQVADHSFSPTQRLKFRAHIFWRRFKMNWSFFSQSRLAVLGLILVIVFGLMAIAYPILRNTVWASSVYDPITGFDMKIFPHPTLPGPQHLLGTDTLGRDVLSRLLAATPHTFVIGLTAAVTTAIVGTILSMTAAYYKGYVDTAITNLADVFLMLPAPVMMVIIGTRFREISPFLLGLFYGILTGAGGTTLVMRAQAIQIVSKPFMEAAQIAGGGGRHIIFRHLLPSLLPLAALQMMVAVTGAVVADGFISFFGITRTTSNWGTIIYEAFVYAGISGGLGIPWHLILPAAMCFSLFALGFYLISRGLHRVASPELRVEY